MYRQGDGMGKDMALASKYHQIAIDRGHDKAASNLGLLYEQGDGVMKDMARAIKCFKVGAHVDDLEAAF